MELNAIFNEADSWMLYRIMVAFSLTLIAFVTAFTFNKALPLLRDIRDYLCIVAQKEPRPVLVEKGDLEKIREEYTKQKARLDSKMQQTIRDSLND
jgi:hypothetical protein